MWRPWDSDSQQVQDYQYSNNESSDGLPVIASDNEETVIFIADRPSPAIQGPCISLRATQALPTFLTSSSDTSSSVGRYVISNL